MAEITGLGWIEKSLKTKDLVEARRRRNREIRAFETEWEGVRQRGTPEAGSLAVEAHEAAKTKNNSEFKSFELSVEAELDALLDKQLPRKGDDEEYREAVDRVQETPRGRELVEALAILKGTRTPLKPEADRWMAMKAPILSKGTVREYKTALNTLTARFSTFEEITKPVARDFLLQLMSTRSKATVQKYAAPYRALFEFQDMDPTLWLLRGLESKIPKLDREVWSDADLKGLLKACDDERMTDLIMIGAFTGARIGGIVDMQVEQGDGGLVLYLPETKTDDSPRRIPCHSSIEGAAKRWQIAQTKNPMTASNASKRFGRLKNGLGHPRTKVFHSFRHSVTTRLEDEDVAFHTIKRIVGHAMAGDMTAYYSKGRSVEKLRPHIAKITWEI